MIKKQKNVTHQSHTPQLIGETGELPISFDLNGHEVYESCGVTHENKFLIYGGGDNKRQVLQVVDCGLASYGTIQFDHNAGACDSSNGIIVLCFDYYDNKQCRQSTAPLGEWNEMPLSTYAHRETKIAMSSGNLVNCRHLK